MNDYRQGAHTIYNIKYHLVWVTKDRQKILQGEIGIRTRNLIRQICEAQELEIIQGHVGVNHIHLFVSAPPRLSVAEIMQSIKGRTARQLQQEYPALHKQHWGQHLWARGYFCVSAGEVTDDLIKAYIEQQDFPLEENYRATEETGRVEGT